MTHSCELTETDYVTLNHATHYLMKSLNFITYDPHTNLLHSDFSTHTVSKLLFKQYNDNYHAGASRHVHERGGSLKHRAEKHKSVPPGKFPVRSGRTGNIMLSPRCK